MVIPNSQAEGKWEINWRFSRCSQHFIWPIWESDVAGTPFSMTNASFSCWQKEKRSWKCKANGGKCEFVCIAIRIRQKRMKTKDYHQSSADDATFNVMPCWEHIKSLLFLDSQQIEQHHCFIKTTATGRSTQRSNQIETLYKLRLKVTVIINRKSKATTNWREHSLPVTPTAAGH